MTHCHKCIVITTVIWEKNGPFGGFSLYHFFSGFLFFFVELFGSIFNFQFFFLSNIPLCLSVLSTRVPLQK